MEGRNNKNLNCIDDKTERRYRNREIKPPKLKIENFVFDISSTPFSAFSAVVTRIWPYSGRGRGIERERELSLLEERVVKF